MYYLYIFLFVPVFLLFAIFGAYRLWLLILYKKAKNIKIKEEELKEFPYVTIQIPVYNELNVVERIIESATKLDYPKEKLEIQILDDSTDETKEIVEEMVLKKKKEGFNIYSIRREKRKGFKAGALKEGLKFAKGEFIAIFDADFIIPHDFLKKTLPYFKEEKIAFVQARWGYLNENENSLTRVEAMILRNHFFLEQEAKFKNGFFFNFNGTAGIWRKSAIIEAGNWNEDTLAEDLDLSLRAYIKGFKGVFLNNLEAPSELPSDLISFIKQQKRWTKGTFQVGLKLWREIINSKNIPLEDKLNILLHTFAPFLYFLNVIFFLILWPLSEYCHILFGLLVLFLGMVNLYNIWAVDKEVKAKYFLKGRLKDMFYLVIVFTSFCFEGTKVVFEAILKKNLVFERTPKRGSNKKIYIPETEGLTKEISKIIYSLLALLVAVKLKIWGIIPWLLLFFLSSLYYFKNGGEIKIKVNSLHHNKIQRLKELKKTKRKFIINQK